MISTISQNSSIIAVSVGNELRVRDAQKPREVGATEVPQEKAVEPKGGDSFEGSQKPRHTSQNIEAVVGRLEEALRHVEPRIELSVDKDLNQVIFRVFDKGSGELIRQIPSEEVLKLERFLADQSGLFVEEDI